MQLGFSDRVDAGKALARLLVRYPRQDSILLAPLNESIIIGKVVGKLLGMPLDLLLVSPLHHPFLWDEIIGAVSLDDLLLATSDHAAYLSAIIPLVRQRLIERMAFFKKGRLLHLLKGKNVIIVTDGCRTGLKLIPSIKMIAQQRPAKIIVASPIISPEALGRLQSQTAGIHCVHSLYTPMPYETTRSFYKDFRLYSDEELAWIFNGPGPIH